MITSGMKKFTMAAYCYAVRIRADIACRFEVRRRAYGKGRARADFVIMSRLHWSALAFAMAYSCPWRRRHYPQGVGAFRFIFSAKTIGGLEVIVRDDAQGLIFGHYLESDTKKINTLSSSTAPGPGEGVEIAGSDCRVYTEAN